jgi:hypothetical protein
VNVVAVLAHVAARLKGHRAKVTFVRSLAAVDAAVRAEDVLGAETFPTHLALIGTLTCTGTNTQFQVSESGNVCAKLGHELLPQFNISMACKSYIF